MHELFPLTAGLLLGALLGLVRPSLRPSVAVIGSILLGFTATLISGEFKASWEYLLFDIPLVAVCAFLGMQVARRVRGVPSSRRT
jgi:hypothetical protein